MKVYKLTTYKCQYSFTTTEMVVCQELFFSSYEKASKTAYLQGRTVMPQAQTQEHCTIKEIEVQ